MVILDAGVHNHIVTWDPVDRSGDLVLVAGLERIDDSKNLGGVPASRGGVCEDCSDGLLRVNDEYGTDRESNALAVDVRGILVINHVIGKRDLTAFVTNDWEFQVRTADFINVLDPFAVTVDGVGGQTDQLDAALGEFGLELGERTQFGGADWGEILRVGEENNPLVTDEFVEVDWAGGSFGLEIGGNGAEAETIRIQVVSSHVAGFRLSFVVWAMQHHLFFRSDAKALGGAAPSPFLFSY